MLVSQLLLVLQVILYLYGFTAQDDVPPILTQGYRIGARVNDKLMLIL
jgi:hypothetical protein